MKLLSIPEESCETFLRYFFFLFSFFLCFFAGVYPRLLMTCDIGEISGRQVSTLHDDFIDRCPVFGSDSVSMFMQRRRNRSSAVRQISFKNSGNDWPARSRHHCIRKALTIAAHKEICLHKVEHFLQL